MKIEVMVLPVSDVDRAKSFHSDQLGFVVDHDRTFNDEMRMVQLTPPGSGWSIQIGGGITDKAPGSAAGTTIVIEDMTTALQQLVDNGVKISEVRDISGFKMAFVGDPDGNQRTLQEIRRNDPNAPK